MGIRKEKSEEVMKNDTILGVSAFRKLHALTNLVSPRDKEIILKLLRRYELISLFRNEYGEDYEKFSSLLNMAYLQFKDAYMHGLADQFLKDIEHLKLKIDKKVIDVQPEESSNDMQMTITKTLN